ncbi:photosystem reaction center subunit H [Deinococcus sp. Arct2-2]|uniref:PRC-barrel domain-containing protein n=1 Tax=Deinococcus sp. Arct2-2 TaxID=2568653 RepID=UPI0010A527E0|nr:PRC-barrel domain-containing protein [Deinococcus sp. Arct2-2]THF68612.1 photosystem reaction center subunit H [Deinococcus sp. Arct2-2]
MIKGKEILGRNIVAISTGERVESVRDVVFDHQGNQVLGLLVDEGGWFHAAKVVPFEKIRSFGEDAIMIGSVDDITGTREDGRLSEAMSSDVSLIGMTLLTTDGQNLGKIADVYFDESTGYVEGYEATGGLFSDLSSGRTFIPTPESVQIGTDAAIVPVSVAAAMQESEAGGLQGALHSAGQSISGAYQNAAEGVKGAYENMAEATKERQKEYSVGKTAGGDITLEDGTVIVHKGDTITEEQVTAAESAGKLGALATAATGGVLAGAYDSAKERVQGGMEDMKTATAERQLTYVVGKTAGSDVTTDTGEVIVHKGVTITPFQAERAQQTGKLGALTAAATGGSISDSVQDIRERREMDPNSLEATVGRRVKTDVRAPSGSLVAAQGQIVTPALADRARHLNAEAALIAATTGAKATSGEASTGAGAGAALAGGVASVSEGASNLIDKAKSWFGEKREQTEEALENRQHEAQEQKIRDALGRPVNRVILAPDDSIILNIGEIVTHKAVESARSGDVLDILLDSISKETVTIDPLSVRPHETGTAALEGQADLGDAPNAPANANDPQRPM